MSKEFRRVENLSQLTLLSRIDRAEREERARQRESDRLLSFILSWEPFRPEKKISTQVIARKFGFSRWTARRRVKDLLARDPAVSVFVSSKLQAKRAS